jgi:hypothetical protein
VSGEKGAPLMMTPHLERDWIPFADQANKEMDSQKLMILIGKLCPVRG